MVQIAPAVHASATIAQEGSTNCSGTSCSVLIGSVAKGSVAIVVLSDPSGCNNCLFSISDSIGTNFASPVPASCDTSVPPGCQTIYAGTVPSSATSDTVTLVYSLQPTQAQDIWVFDVSGITTNGVVYGTGSSGGSTGSSIATGSTPDFSNGFEIAVAGSCNGGGCSTGGSYTAGSGFTLASDPSGDVYSAVETSTSASGSTTFPMTLGTASFWNEYGVAFEPSSYSSPVVQSTSINYGSVYTASSGTTLTPSATFPSSVTSGDVVVVGLIIQDGFCSLTCISSVADTRGTSFTSPASTECSSSGVCVGIWYGTLSSSGSDTVTVTYPVSPGNKYPTDIYLYEVSGITTTGATASVGTSTSSSMATGGSSFSSQGFAVSVGGIYGYGESITPGSNFALEPFPAGGLFAVSQFSTSGLTSPTTFPIALGSSQTWSYYGVVFNAGSAVPDLPLGMLPVALIFVALYLLVVRRGSLSLSRMLRRSS